MYCRSFGCGPASSWRHSLIVSDIEGEERETCYGLDDSTDHHPLVQYNYRLSNRSRIVGFLYPVRKLLGKLVGLSVTCNSSPSRSPAPAGAPTIT